MTLENESKKSVLKTVRDCAGCAEPWYQEGGDHCIQQTRPRACSRELAPLLRENVGSCATKYVWGPARCLCINERAWLIVEASAGI